MRLATSFESKSEESRKTIGDLDAKAQGLAKIMGSAELGGKIQNERQTIYKNSSAAEAARYDAYLAYMFCTFIMQDNKLDGQAKLKALQEFRKPVSDLNLRTPVLAALAENVNAAAQRARDEAEVARRIASEYPRNDVDYSLRRVEEIKLDVVKRLKSQPDYAYSNGSLHWGSKTGNGRDCCADGDYIGEYVNDSRSGYGRLETDELEIIAKFDSDRPNGAGCITYQSQRLRVCGIFNQQPSTGLLPE
jgi:hypothetical protein